MKRIGSMFRFSLCGLAMLGASTFTHAQQADESIGDQLLIQLFDAVDWLESGNDPHRKALALLVRADSAAQTGERLLQPISALIGSAEDGATIQILTRICVLWQIVPRCNEAGLADAMARLDPDNLLTLALLSRGQTQRLETIVSESTRVDDYMAEFIADWWEALKNHPPSDGSPEDALNIAVSLYQGLAAPEWQPLVEICSIDRDERGELAESCGALGQRMVDRARSNAELIVGYSLLAQSAQDPAAAEAVDRRYQAWAERHRCLAQHIDTAVSNELWLQQHYINDLVLRGEPAAVDAMGRRLDADCPDA